MPNTKPDPKLISLTPPAFPLWVVNYYVENDGISIDPVITLALVESYEEHDDLINCPRPGETRDWAVFQTIRPISFFPNEMFDSQAWDGEGDEYILGYSNTPITEAEARTTFESGIASKIKLAARRKARRVMKDCQNIDGGQNDHHHD